MLPSLLFVSVLMVTTLLTMNTLLSGLFDRLVPFFMAAALGVAGNDLYQQKARKTLAKIRAARIDPAAMKAALIKAGGTSVLNVAVIAVVILAWAAVIVYAPLGGGDGWKAAGSIDYGQSTLYYGGSVGEDEARLLGDYFVQSGFFSDDGPVDVWVRRRGDAWQLRMIVIESEVKVDSLAGTLKHIGWQVSRDVFGEAPLEIEYCDAQLRKIGSVEAAPQPESGAGFLGTELPVGVSTLHYVVPVSEDEALRLARFLAARGAFVDDRATLQVRRSGPTYFFRLPVMEGIDQSEEYAAAFRQFAAELSEGVFDGAPVVIQMCDAAMRTLRTIRVGD